MITLNIQIVNKIIILFAATNKCQFFVSSYQRALQKSQQGKIRYMILHKINNLWSSVKETMEESLDALTKFMRLESRE